MNERIKRRILFVDDEVMVLKGLQRTLRKMRHEWEMTFTNSGRKALDILDKKLAHHPSPAMAFFPPGIGKIDMDRGNRIIGHALGKQRHRIAVQYFNVAAAGLGDSSGREVCILANDFDSQKDVQGLSDTGALQEQTLAAADFNFERP